MRDHAVISPYVEKGMATAARGSRLSVTNPMIGQKSSHAGGCIISTAPRASKIPRL